MGAGTHAALIQASDANGGDLSGNSEAPISGRTLPQEREPQKSTVLDQLPVTRLVITNEDWRKQELSEVLQNGNPDLQEEVHQSYCTGTNKALSLEKGDRGEADLIKFEIYTGDASPVCQTHPIWSTTGRQLREMQEAGVIEPSNSLWSSPMVPVRKKNGMLRFCVDYRELNLVTRLIASPSLELTIFWISWESQSFFNTELGSGKSGGAQTMLKIVRLMTSCKLTLVKMLSLCLMTSKASSARIRKSLKCCCSLKTNGSH